MEDLTRDLGPKDYTTSTRGSRSVEAARALGEGQFKIAIRAPCPSALSCIYEAFIVSRNF